MDPKKALKYYLYHPQPLNYKRVSGNERMFYEWLLGCNIFTEIFYPKDPFQYKIKLRLW